MSDQVAIDERIHKLVEAHREELELLVDEAVEAELAQLVAERLAARNGATQVGDASTSAQVADDAPAVKVCSGCGEAKPLSEFERYRSKCRPCRRSDAARARERRAAAAPALQLDPAADPDRPAIPLDELHARAVVGIHGAVGIRDLSRWLLAENLATPTRDGLVATRRCVELVGAIA